ncbi:hypothetical protein BD408DRAFT_484481 [Parasitella parasitica]|nr:hypothetical protein BD408DRAFT_484481 [Parasitella parasitica]
MKFSIAAIFVAVASTVYAQTAAVPNAGVAVNLPGYGAVVNAGTSYTITWTIDTASTNPSTTINSIALMKGGSANLETTIPNILSAAIPVNPPSYSWNIPANVETAPSYVLAFAGSNGATTYSTYFTIVGAAPGTSNATIASSSAPVASAASSAASASGKPSASASASAASAASAASGIKAGVMGVAGIAAGAIAILL